MGSFQATRSLNHVVNEGDHTHVMDHQENYHYCFLLDEYIEVYSTWLRIMCYTIEKKT